MPLRDEDVSEILRIIDSSQLDELEIETPSFALRVTRDGGGGKRGPASPGRAPAREAPAAAAPTPAGAHAKAPGETGAPGEIEASAEIDAPGQIEATGEIEAPMLGTFYRTESPAHPPFVQVGDRVEPDSVVCLIEVMKLMNHIQAGVSGTIVEILAQSGELVEFGQPLFRVALERE